MKVARTVLNGESGGNAADLHNREKPVRDRTYKYSDILKVILIPFKRL